MRSGWGHSVDPGKGWARGLGVSEERWGQQQGWAVAQQKVTPERSGSALGQSGSHGGAGSDHEVLDLCVYLSALACMALCPMPTSHSRQQSPTHWLGQSCSPEKEPEGRETTSK